MFKTNELSPRYIGSSHIISRVGEVTYQLGFPPSLSRLHDVFYVSQLRKFVSNSFQPILSDIVEVATNLSFQP